MIPVPGFPISTPYRKRGRWWSCDRNSAGEGVHTGVDYAAPKGTPVVAARPGVVRHTSWGKAFGPYQFAIVAPDGSCDFYAHTLDRPKDGALVGAGAKVARVGALGNVTGAHLHFERLPSFAKGWTCANHTNPSKSINWEEPMGVEYHYGGKPSGVQVVKTKYLDVERGRWNPLRKGLEHAMLYINVTKPKFKTGKSVGAIRVRAIREKTNDKTSYHDYVIHLDASDGTSQLVTHTYFESGDGGPTRYQVKCIGGLVEATITTRYRKGAVVY